MTVYEWLSRLGMEQYADAFEDQGGHAPRRLFMHVPAIMGAERRRSELRRSIGDSLSRKGDSAFSERRSCAVGMHVPLLTWAVLLSAYFADDINDWVTAAPVPYPHMRSLSNASCIRQAMFNTGALFASHFPGNVKHCCIMSSTVA
eukprot:3941266-Rhodomonas_salina.9